jgi:nucleoside-diphosphate-sugar epimerase
MAVCLIAGGAGFLGSHLAEALLARGDTVRIVDNFSHGTPANLAPQVEVIPGDVRSHGLVRRAMDGVDQLFHLAVPWAGSVAGPLNSAAAGAVGTWHLLLAARDAGCRRVVLASGGEVYGRAEPARVDEETAPAPATPVAKDALLAEQEAVSFARSYGIGLVRLRFFNVFGPRQGRRAPGPNIGRILEAMAAGTRPVLYDHELEPVDLLYVEDAVRGCLLAGNSDRQDGRVYHIAHGRAARAEDVVARLNVLLGTDLLPVLAGPCSTIPPGALPDVVRARVELGFSAHVDLSEGLRQCVDVVRADPSGPAAANFGPQFTVDR